MKLQWNIYLDACKSTNSTNEEWKYNEIITWIHVRVQEVQIKNGNIKKIWLYSYHSKKGKNEECTKYLLKSTKK